MLTRKIGTSEIKTSMRLFRSFATSLLRLVNHIYLPKFGYFAVKNNAGQKSK